MSSLFSIPHEGITQEFLARPIPHVLLQPLITGGLLALNILKPEQIISRLPPQIREYLVAQTTNKVLTGLVIAGLIYRAHVLLNRLSLNNWASDKTWNISKEIVVVTGGNSGIGKAMVENFASKGYQVASLDISEPKNALPNRVHFFKADVTNSEAIHSAAEKIRKELGEPTVIVNNAGVGHAKEILKETEQEIRLTIGVNLLSHFLMFREFAPALIKNNHGHIVTIASMASFMCQASNVDYASTKAGVLAFHEGIAQELKHRYGANKVRTSVVHPIWVRTALTGPLYDSGRFKELTIQPETVSDAVVNQVIKAESAQLILPNRLTVASGIRGWPSFLQEGLRNQMAKTLEGYQDELESELAKANAKK